MNGVVKIPCNTYNSIVHVTVATKSNYNCRNTQFCTKFRFSVFQGVVIIYVASYMYQHVKVCVYTNLKLNTITVGS